VEDVIKSGNDIDCGISIQLLCIAQKSEMVRFFLDCRQPNTNRGAVLKMTRTTVRGRRRVHFNVETKKGEVI
jgi:hypothetical protein